MECAPATGLAPVHGPTLHPHSAGGLLHYKAAVPRWARRWSPFLGVVDEPGLPASELAGQGHKFHCELAVKAPMLQLAPGLPRLLLALCMLGKSPCLLSPPSDPALRCCYPGVVRRGGGAAAANLPPGPGWCGLLPGLCEADDGQERTPQLAAAPAEVSPAAQRIVSMCPHSHHLALFTPQVGRGRRADLHLSGGEAGRQRAGQPGVTCRPPALPCSMACLVSGCWSKHRPACRRNSVTSLAALSPPPAMAPLQDERLAQWAGDCHRARLQAHPSSSRGPLCHAGAGLKPCR